MPDRKISQFINGGLVQAGGGDIVAGVRGGDNYYFIFGSGAGLNAGILVGDLITWYDNGGSPAYPPLDGSLITNLPPSPVVQVTVSDDAPGYLDEKIEVDNGLTKTTETDSSGIETLLFDVRHSFATPASVGSGTHTMNIADGDYHTITSTGSFTLAANMENGEALMVRAIGFDDYSPANSFDWGTVGEPTWTGKDDFVIYRDGSGNYIASAIVIGLS